VPFDFNRRQMIRSMVSGSTLLPAIVQQCLAESPVVGGDPLAVRASHFAPKAKRVIFLFSSGGVSHMETFDPKPALTAAAREGKKAQNGKVYLAPRWEFKRDSKCGLEVSELFPWTRKCMDDICVIRSMHGDHNDHAQATLGVHTGSVTFARPSFGSWVSYGLGTENRNLPSFVVIAPSLPYAGAQVWNSDFLPGAHSGTLVTPGKDPVPNLARKAATPELQQLELSLLDRFNRKHQSERPGDARLDARIKSFETAFGMQMEMPDVLDLSKETDATLGLYGLERGSTKGFAWQCLVARRLAERGVRFIELIDVGSSNNWDAHGNMKTHEPLAKNIDRAVYGLLNDLKSRGMLDETLVVWTSEFGRSPWPDSPEGRSHHVSVYSSWLAGGGVQGGIAYGASDEFGNRPAENPVHVHDFHATILHQLGFDHTKLTFRHAGRDFRLTDVAGKVVQPILRGA
jgi:hypothetical protein